VALADVSIVFETRVHPKYQQLECTGTFSLEAFLPLYEQTFTLAASAGRDAVLIDVRNVTGREPTLAERYTQAVHVAELQSAQTSRIRLAVLGHEPLVHKERFGQIVATNRGALVGVFTDEVMTLDWLVARPSSA
jgi:hypothetical protein